MAHRSDLDKLVEKDIAKALTAAEQAAKGPQTMSHLENEKLVAALRDAGFDQNHVGPQLKDLGLEPSKIDQLVAALKQTEFGGTRFDKATPALNQPTDFGESKIDRLMSALKRQTDFGQSEIDRLMSALKRQTDFGGSKFEEAASALKDNALGSHLKHLDEATAALKHADFGGSQFKNLDQATKSLKDLDLGGSNLKHLDEATAALKHVEFGGSNLKHLDEATKSLKTAELTEALKTAGFPSAAKDES